MKIKFELPDEYKNEQLVLCKVFYPEPIAYLNVYEEGDVLLKIQGCEKCSIENKRKCCSGCPMSSNEGCFFHLENKGRNSNKPFKCVVLPRPDSSFSHCCLQYKIIAGSNKGKIRKISNKGNIFE